MSYQNCKMQNQQLVKLQKEKHIHGCTCGQTKHNHFAIRHTKKLTALKCAVLKLPWKKMQKFGFANANLQTHRHIAMAHTIILKKKRKAFDFFIYRLQTFVQLGLRRSYCSLFFAEQLIRTLQVCDRNVRCQRNNVNKMAFS